jgi:hypothetical protein
LLSLTGSGSSTPKTDKAEGITFGLASVGDGGLELLLDSSKESPILEETGAESGAIDWVALLKLIQACVHLPPGSRELAVRLLRALASEAT